MAFVDDHAQRYVSIGEIAAAARVGPRTVQALFRRHLGQPPLMCLQQVRMQGAHRDLQLGDPTRGDTVGDIARRWCFTHPGRFAVAYRRTYGQQPRTTLNRVCETQPCPQAATVSVALLDRRGRVVWTQLAPRGAVRIGNGPELAVGVDLLDEGDAADADPWVAVLALRVRAAIRGELSAPVRAPVSSRLTSLASPRGVEEVLVATRRDDDGRILGATVTVSPSGALESGLETLEPVTVGR